MTTPAILTRRALARSGYVVQTVERWLTLEEGKRVRVDFIGVGDLLAFHDVRPETLLIQCTTASNLAARVKKARAEPRLRKWLAQPHRVFQVWGWMKRAGTWQPRVVELTADDLSTEVISAPKRRGRRPVQAGLFDGIGGSCRGGGSCILSGPDPRERGPCGPC